MNYPYVNEILNPFLNQQEFDIVSFNSDNDNYLNEIYSLGMEKNLNIFEPDFISNEITWNTGGKTGITESDSKNKSCQKFVIDKIEYSES